MGCGYNDIKEGEPVKLPTAIRKLCDVCRHLCLARRKCPKQAKKEEGTAP